MKSSFQRILRRNREAVALVLVLCALFAMYLLLKSGNRRQTTHLSAAESDQSGHSARALPPALEFKEGSAIRAEQKQHREASSALGVRVPPEQQSDAEQRQALEVQWPRRHWMTGILASSTGLGNRLFHAASLYGLARASGSHTALFFPGDHLPCQIFGCVATFSENSF